MKARLCRKKWAAPAALIALLVGTMIAAVAYACVTLPSPLFTTDYSTVVLDEHGAILRAFLNSQEQWILLMTAALSLRSSR